MKYHNRDSNEAPQSFSTQKTALGAYNLCDAIRAQYGFHARNKNLIARNRDASVPSKLHGC